MTNIRVIETCEYGIEIKKALAEKRMTQKDLAEQLGVLPQYLTMIISGRKKSKKYTKKINKLLGIVGYEELPKQKMKRAI